MNTHRWEAASTLEQEWWQQWKKRTDLSVARRELEARAAVIQKQIDKYHDGESVKILQLGPAANGEIHFLKGDRSAVDPLADFFRQNFQELIDPKVDFIQEMAEKLPFPDASFDVILIINVLDHCCDPEKVLAQIDRCLSDGGILILGVNAYNRAASALHSVFGFVDREHPHALTRQFFDTHLTDYALLEEDFEAVAIPEHDVLKKTVLLILKTLALAPRDYRFVARKNPSRARGSQSEKPMECETCLK